jgi:hypothetical protein
MSTLLEKAIEKAQELDVLDPMLLVNTARGSGATARSDASCGARGSRPPFAIAEPSLGSSAEARIPA